MLPIKPNTMNTNEKIHKAFNNRETVEVENTLSLTKTIELNIETKKGFCDILQQKVDYIYVNGQIIAKIKEFRNRRQKKWYQAMGITPENFIATVYKNQFGLTVYRNKRIKTRRGFYSEMERELRQWFNQI